MLPGMEFVLVNKDDFKDEENQYQTSKLIKQYEPDVLLLPEQKAQIYRAGGIRVRENTAERTELLFWT